MRPKNKPILIIAVSMLVAAALLLSSYELDGMQYKQTAIYVLLAVWLIPFLWLSKKAGKHAV